MTDVAIIGGGASGLATAIMILQRCPSAAVTVFEKNSRVGKKLSVTGNGRCNITNTCLGEERYHGDPVLAARLLKDFGYDRQREFFRSLGVLFTEEDGGKIYPMSLQAASVTDALRLTVEELGARVITDCTVTAVQRSGNGFAVATSDEITGASAVVIACGGKAGGKLGSMSGYEFLRQLGHKITSLSPAIVQLRTDSGLVRSLKGVKIDGNVTVTSDAGTRTESGEILFTDYGISGPPVLQVSRYAEASHAKAILDLLPRMTEEEIASHLFDVINHHPARLASEIFDGFINKRLGSVALKHSGATLGSKASEIPDTAVRSCSAFLKQLTLTVNGTTGFENAQVTAGGADTAQFFDTLMSKKAPGLFATGEILNVDGDCGGFNLAFCWASANAAANGVIDYIRKHNG